MIDEKKLKKELAELSLKCPFSVFDERFALYTECFEKAICLLKDQPKVNEWIPVEEILPEESLKSVIGWDEYRERCCFVQYYNKRWKLGNDEPVKITAWMPVPEPYKGDE